MLVDRKVNSNVNLALLDRMLYVICTVKVQPQEEEECCHIILACTLRNMVWWQETYCENPPYCSSELMWNPPPSCIVTHHWKGPSPVKMHLRAEDLHA